MAEFLFNQQNRTTNVLTASSIGTVCHLEKISGKEYIARMSKSMGRVSLVSILVRMYKDARLGIRFFVRGIVVSAIAVFVLTSI